MSIEQLNINLENVSQSEKVIQIEYLRNTPVRGIADLLESGSCELKIGIVNSLEFLRDLKTEFGEIGDIKPQSTEGQPKFTVGEIVPALENKLSVNDGGLLNNIKSIAAAEKQGKIEFNVTILLANGEPIIKDGNKRTIAFYENRKHDHYQKISYRVFVVCIKPSNT